MILDETTHAQALIAFANPKTDKPGQQFRPMKYNEWFDTKGRKDFHLLHYENIEGFKDVKLYFG